MTRKMIPNDMNGSNSKLIYLYLSESEDPKSPSEISDELNITMLAVLPILRRMKNSGYIERSEEDEDLYRIADETEE